MPYTPFNRPTSEFRSGINILASRMRLKYTESGGTIDAAATGKKYIPVGFPFIRVVATGKYVPFTAETTGAAYTDPVLTNVDFNCDGEHDVVVGELMYSGSVYEPKLPEEVTAEFKAATPLIRYVTL